MPGSFTPRVLALAALAPIASAADLYVAQSAAGSGSGADAANPHPVAWFNAGSSWGAGAGQIGPGATVHLCGTIATDLSVGGSGTAGHPITIRFEPNAKISQPVCGIAIAMNGRDFIVIDGGTNGIIENTDNRTSGQHLGSVGIQAQSCDDCEIANLAISNLYVHTGTASEVDHGGIQAISFSGSRWRIHDNVMHDIGWCLVNTYHPGDADVRVYRNDISRIDHGYTLATGSGAAGPFSFYNNHVHDYANWDADDNAYHHDGIHAFAWAGEPHIDGGFWIYDNLFDGDIGTHITGHIFLEGGSGAGRTPWADYSSSVHVFNNVFSSQTNHRNVYGLVQLYKGTGFEVYNNTILGGNPSDGIGLAIGDTTLSKVKNNFISGFNCELSLQTTFADVANDLDHNVYADCASYNAWTWGAIDTSDFAQWQSRSHGDAHSLATLTTPGGVGADGRPAAGSPVIGAGANLSTVGIVPLDADKGGIARPASGAWDVGAFQYVGGGTGTTTGGGTGGSGSGTTGGSGSGTTGGSGTTTGGASSHGAGHGGCGAGGGLGIAAAALTLAVRAFAGRRR